MTDLDRLADGAKTVVVNVDRLAEDAYYMGHDAFQDADVLPDADETDRAYDLSPWKSGARWANITLPRLRCMAGNADPTGKGTWTERRLVVAVRDHNVDDDPAPCGVVSSGHLADLAVDWFDRGAYAALEGEPAECDTGEIVAV